MTLMVNGKTHEHRGDPALKALLADIGAEGRPVAVVVNGEVVPRDQQVDRILREGDTVDVLTFAAGG